MMRSTSYLGRTCGECSQTGRRILLVIIRTEDKVVMKGFYLGNAVFRELLGASQSQLRVSEKSSESMRERGTDELCSYKAALPLP
jgi:hypothetical protein